jgi:hypothetical protein
MNADNGFVKVTEHYGYSFLPDHDDPQCGPAYYVVHKDEQHALADIDGRRWLFHSKNKDHAITVCHHLEYENYILDKGDA